MLLSTNCLKESLRLIKNTLQEISSFLLNEFYCSMFPYKYLHFSLSGTKEFSKKLKNKQKPVIYLSTLSEENWLILCEQIKKSSREPLK